MYLASYFAFYKARFMYLLLGVGFVAWSILGMKKAVLFLYPLTFVGMYYIINFKGRSLRVAKHIIYLGLIIVLTISVSLLILRFNRQLNPERKIGGTANLNYALEYSKKYTTSKDLKHPTVATGRFSTLMSTFETLKKGGFGIFLFGYGPGAFTSSVISDWRDRRLFKFAAGYGMTPLTYTGLEYGMSGIITYGLIIIIFLRMCWRYYSYETDPYWKAFSAGSLGLAFFMIFLFCAYNYISILGDSFPLMYFYIMGVIFVRLNKTSRNGFSQSVKN
jgi:hypothetical protein